MAKLRILLAGCHGLLGQRIVERTPGDVFLHGVDLHETSFLHGKNFQYTHIDIRDRKDVKQLCRGFKPDVIVNTAAHSHVDACETEKEQCWRINVEGVENLVKSAQQIDAKVIHFSTDYIFDGRKKLYREDDSPGPLNYYGKSKLASENIIRSSGLAWTIIRTSTLYDVDTLKGRQNFVTWVLQNLQQGKSIRVVTDQSGNPTLARNLASAVWNVIAENRSGVYHICGRDVIDRYAFAKKTAEVFDLNEWLIEPVTTEQLGQAAPRPLRTGLDVAKAEKDISVDLMGVDEGLAVFKKDYLAVHRIN